MEDTEEVAALSEVSSAWPFSLAFWNILQCDSRSWHCKRRVWYVSFDWYCWYIQSQASWYCTVCCRTMLLSIFLVFWLGNVHWLTSMMMHVLRAWILSLGLWCMFKMSSPQECQKWSSDFMVVAMATNSCMGVFWCYGVIVKHAFKLFPASLGITGLICIDVDGFHVVENPGVGGLPVIHLLGWAETEFRNLPMWGVRYGCHSGTTVGRDCLGKTVDYMGSTGTFGVLLGDLFTTLGRGYGSV